MASIAVQPKTPSAPTIPLLLPWPWMALGLALAACSALWSRMYGAPSDWRVVPAALGLICAGAAVAMRMTAPSIRSLPAGFERLLSGALLAVSLTLAVAMTVLAGLSIVAPLTGPYKAGLTCIFWLTLVPACCAGIVDGLRRLRHNLPLPGLEGSALLWLAALTAFLGSLGLQSPQDPQSWDTMRFFLRIIAVAAVVGAVLVFTTPLMRRLVISFLVVFHFAGISMAGLNSPPTPWLVTQIWARVYRPYLEFLYLTNAYHFYAPEPGPSTHLWIRIIYTDPDGQESGVWEKIPRMDGAGHSKHTVALEFQRYLAMNERTTPNDPPPPSITISKEGSPEQAPFYARRLAHVPRGRTITVGVNRPSMAIPFDPLVAESRQFAVPSWSAKQLLTSMARHAARMPHPDDAKEPGKPPRYQVKSVKIYRVMHDIVSSNYLAAGMDPNDPTLFHPYFMGEFRPDGTLADPDDPYLYWLLPIMRDGVLDRSGTILNYAARHAGDPRWVMPAGAKDWEEPKQP